MKVIVDANIVFSGILNTKGKIGDILINSQKHFNFIAPYFLQKEIQKHYSRLVKISGLSLKHVKEAETYVCKKYSLFLRKRSSLFTGCHQNIWLPILIPMIYPTLLSPSISDVSYGREIKC